MKKKISILALIILAIVVVVSMVIILNSNKKEDNKQEKKEDNITQQTVIPLSAEKILNSMSTKDKIAQMLMPAFRTYNNEKVTKLNGDIKEIIQKYGFAGVILFDENNETTEQTVKLIDEMQTANAKERKNSIIDCC